MVFMVCVLYVLMVCVMSVVSIFGVAYVFSFGGSFSSFWIVRAIFFVYVCILFSNVSVVLNGNKLNFR